MSQNLHLEQTQRLALSPQQIRFVKLLEMNAPELEETVKKELEENIALEEKEPSAENYSEMSLGPSYNRSSNEDETPSFTPTDREESIYDNLLSQLSERDLSHNVEEGAKYIIGNLDSNGYLDRPLNNIIDDLAFNEGIDLTPQEGEEALDAVRSLDPPGIGAFNLRDSLLLQLEALPPDTTRDNAILIIKEGYEAFTMKHKHRLISQLHLSSKEVDEALELIKSLNPRPGAALGSSVRDEASVIIPDFIVNVEDDDITVSLNSRIPELQIDSSFETAVANMERSAKGRAKKGSEYIMRNYNDAREFIAILSQRQRTMMDVMTAIVKIQKDYFITQDVYTLRPMMIKNVSELTGLDFSVISRATNGKYVSTPWGIFPLRFFFSDSVGNVSDGSEALTNRKIEEEIRSLVENEDKRHPLSDQHIMEEMSKRGYDISRRTVAKYRDRLRIPVARL
ncbi:MAG: RNA polymerase factor sigma-54, partial [Muribaculaceae bacterium]|nr:RNA polymerase factor sigma-54 [Muribaculaceae bacterium]